MGGAATAKRWESAECRCFRIPDRLACERLDLSVRRSGNHFCFRERSAIYRERVVLPQRLARRHVSGSAVHGRLHPERTRKRPTPCRHPPHRCLNGIARPLLRCPIGSGATAIELISNIFRECFIPSLQQANKIESIVRVRYARKFYRKIFRHLLNKVWDTAQR